MKLNRIVMFCAALVAGVILQSCCCGSPISGENYKFKNGMIVFDEPQRAITKSQAVVLYDGDIVVGGGEIQ